MTDFAAQLDAWTRGEIAEHPTARFFRLLAEGAREDIRRLRESFYEPLPVDRPDRIEAILRAEGTR